MTSNDNATVINIHNQSAIRVIRNAVFHKRPKHVDICSHFIRERVVSGEIDVRYVRSECQHADILTKALSHGQFLCLREKIAMKLYE